MRRKKQELLLLLILVMGIIFCFSGSTNAHSVELDPKSLINYPLLVTNGKGKITIKESETGYTLYYQAVEIPETVYAQIKQTDENATKKLDNIKKEIDALKVECNNKEEVYDEAYKKYSEKNKTGSTDTELEKLKKEYETAKTEYQNKVKEYNDKIYEYNNLVNQANAKIKELTPMYVESNWIKTTDGSFVIDSSKFSDNRAFTIWAKLVSSDGTITYDEQIFVVNGTKKEDVKVKAISIDKTTITLKRGSSYTLKATISPENATNQSITWTSDNNEVATVSEGKITAKANGIATITATTADGNFTATCKVTVNDENDKKILEKIEVKSEKNKDFSFIGYVGQKLNKKGLVVTLTYSDGTTKDISTGYTISPDEKFAKADDGKMKVLEVKYTEDKVTKTCEIYIKVMEDPTIKDDDLPNTGAAVVMLIITIICSTTVIGYLGYKKYKQI